MRFHHNRWPRPFSPGSWLLHCWCESQFATKLLTQFSNTKGILMELRDGRGDHCTAQTAIQQPNGVRFHEGVRFTQCRYWPQSSMKSRILLHIYTTIIHPGGEHSRSYCTAGRQRAATTHLSPFRQVDCCGSAGGVVDLL